MNNATSLVSCDLSPTPVHEADAFFARFRDIDPRNYDFEGCRTATDGIGPILPQDVYAAILFAEGNVNKVAALLRRPRNTMARWLQANPEFMYLQRDLTEGVLDQVEEVVQKSAMAGDGANARFLLSTKGKDRGYTTRQEVTGKDGAEFRANAIADDRIDEATMQRMAVEVLSRLKGSDAQVIGANYEEIP